jgi:hypothetical protein
MTGRRSPPRLGCFPGGIALAGTGSDGSLLRRRQHDVEDCGTFQGRAWQLLLEERTQSMIGTLSRMARDPLYGRVALHTTEKEEFRSYEIHCRGMAEQARTDSEREEWTRMADAWARKCVAAVPGSDKPR